MRQSKKECTIYIHKTKVPGKRPISNSVSPFPTPICAHWPNTLRGYITWPQHSQYGRSLVRCTRDGRRSVISGSEERKTPRKCTVECQSSTEAPVCQLDRHMHSRRSSTAVSEDWMKYLILAQYQKHYGLWKRSCQYGWSGCEIEHSTLHEAPCFSICCALQSVHQVSTKTTNATHKAAADGSVQDSAMTLQN